MKNPNLKTTVVHSQSNNAWNVVGAKLGDKYKIARVPYIVTKNEEIDERSRQEALDHAMFISFCFNNADRILDPYTGTENFV